jgi:hypothetical protein
MKVDINLIMMYGFFQCFLSLRLILSSFQVKLHVCIAGKKAINSSRIRMLVALSSYKKLNCVLYRFHFIGLLSVILKLS